jgi:hypothetical protein
VLIPVLVTYDIFVSRWGLHTLHVIFTFNMYSIPPTAKLLWCFDFRLLPWNKCCFFGFGIFARCVRWTYGWCFRNSCESHLHWSWVRISHSYSWPVKTGPHSGFQNVVSKFTLHTMQKPQNQKTTFYDVHIVQLPGLICAVMIRLHICNWEHMLGILKHSLAVH